jgi:Glycosyl transferase family 41
MAAMQGVQLQTGRYRSSIELPCMAQIFCYALSPPDSSEWRTRIEGEVEHFTDVSSWSIPDIAARISADGIQVRCFRS